jgi:methylenetetrahydrofolate dehydrogenase (NADP+) / methenyltetrahydrofolate cyclohydrolase
MPARILDGRAIAAAVRDDLLPLVKARSESLGHAPGLAIVHVGADPASTVYARRLAQTAESVGVAVRMVALPHTSDDAALRKELTALNADRSVQGILMQLPLPAHLDQRTVAETLDASKDVDGISLRSSGNLLLRLPTFVPSTSAAILEMLERHAIAIAGRRAVIVGASNVVGKPLAFMLLDRDATVTVCHAETRNLAEWTRQGDILVVAVGKPGIVTGDMVRPGATVIDVGINVIEATGAVVGDVDQRSVAKVAGALTPVPGGIGPLTSLMVLKQLVSPITLTED